jgi:putative ABC transport system ATP-binding protein
MKNIIIKLEYISKRYRSGTDSILALHDLNLDIFEGDFVVIMGPSGSGKTTLLNVIAGLSPPTEGQVIVQGKNIKKLSGNQKAEMRRNSFGFIFQFYNLHEGLTAKENIELPMLIAKNLPRKKRQFRSQELLETVNLADRAENLPFELSGGERQRVGIARSIANNPPLILADEPTGDLDSKNATEILNLLVRLNDQFNKTLVVVTHDPSILRPGMRLLTMEDGKIISDRIVTTNTIEDLQIQNSTLINEIALDI